MSDNLQDKISESIALIQNAEKLALKMQPNHGFYIAFSGGKDSQAVLELTKLAGVKYQAYYNVTTNDPPENIYFIRRHYPDVHFIHPARNFFKIVEHYGLPTQQYRFCCKELKETNGVGFVVVTGVRKDESYNRSQYSKIRQWGKNKKNANSYNSSNEIDFQCVNGRDKFLIYPLLEWSESDVWQFLAKRKLPYNPCYDNSSRLGCMFCCYSSADQIKKYSILYPKFKETLLDRINIFLNTHKKSSLSVFVSPEDYFDWWVSKTSIKDYLAAKNQLELPLELQNSN